MAAIMKFVKNITYSENIKRQNLIIHDIFHHTVADL